MANSKRRSAGDEFDGDDDRTAGRRDEPNADDVDADFDGMLDQADDDGADDDAAAGASRSRRAGSAAVQAKARPPAARAKTAEERAGIIGRLYRFIAQVVAELQKVIWPTRKELLTYTSVVVVFVAIMMTFIALLDVGFAKVMFLVFGGKTNS